MWEDAFIRWLWSVASVALGAIACVAFWKVVFRADLDPGTKTALTVYGFMFSLLAIAALARVLKRSTP